MYNAYLLEDEMFTIAALQSLLSNLFKEITG